MTLTMTKKMTPQEAEEYGCVIIEKVLISRRHYNVLKELAELNEQDLAFFLKSEREYLIEDMAFNDPEHIAKIMAMKWRKELGLGAGAEE